MPEPRGEFERIAGIVAGLGRGEGVVVGPGDDAAVLRPRAGHDLVATSDTFVEGRHFGRDLLSPAEIGARLAAANLSDLAAMAAAPRWALVSLVCPPAWSAEACEHLEHACARAFEAQGAAVVGGNLSGGDGPLVATVTLLGELEPGRAWRRRGAVAGDVLAVTGVPGSAAAALALARRGTPASWAHVPAELRRAYVSPEPRLRLARTLAAEGGVHAALDLSDGLSGDLERLCHASGVGAVLESSRLARSDALWAAARAWSAVSGPERGAPPAEAGDLLTQLQLAPSDDYELLLAIDPAAWPRCSEAAVAAGAPLTAIGATTERSGLRLVEGGGRERDLAARGWDHFSARG